MRSRENDMSVDEWEDISYGDVGGVMLAKVPALADLYQLSVYGGDLMVTVFLGNVAQYVLEQVSVRTSLSEDKRQAADARVTAILEVVERGVCSVDEKLKGAISAGFLEEIATDDEAVFLRIVRILGPRSRGEVRKLARLYKSKEWLEFLRGQDAT